jgi:hypothetical protein
MPCGVTLEFLQPGIRPGLWCVWRSFFLKPIPARVKWGALRAPERVQSGSNVKFGTLSIVARRIYARILCELWIAIKRRILQ